MAKKPSKPSKKKYIFHQNTTLDMAKKQFFMKKKIDPVELEHFSDFEMLLLN